MFNPTLRASNLEELTIEKYEELVGKLSKIDENNIDKELLEHSTYYSYYYGLMVRAKKLFNKAEIIRDTYKSEKRVEAIKTNTGKKLTAVTLDDTVNCIEEFKNLNTIVLDREEIYGLMRGICASLEHKKDMLVQLSANKREEAKLYK